VGIPDKQFNGAIFKRRKEGVVPDKRSLAVVLGTSDADCTDSIGREKKIK